MKSADVVVLNDMHPADFPGAATIAFNHAKYVSENLNVEFWHTSNTRTAPYASQRLRIRSFYRSTRVDEFVRRYMGTRILNEFFPSLILFKILISLFILRPKVVWVHQIGVRIPRTITLFLKFLGIKSLHTYHDFGVISPRKLYPSNITENNSALLSTNRLINFFYLVRLRCLVKIANMNFQNICISQFQLDIYKAFGVRNVIQIPNGIDICTCKLDKSFEKIPNTVFFAGRTTGKGFERICQLVKMDASWKLTAAGGLDLKEIGLKYLGNDQFTYLGFLEPNELFKQIHKSELVSVLSECFDVYPTIALEAFMHNSIPITSLSTGIVQLVEKSGCGIILDDAKEQLTLEQLKKYIYRQPNFPIKEIELCTSGDRYLRLLKPAT